MRCLATVFGGLPPYMVAKPPYMVAVTSESGINISECL